ncbi:MAG: DUF3089 domain-containing protein, partial [Novosphingobium sp.]
MKVRSVLAAMLGALAAPALAGAPAPDYAQAQYWSTVDSLPQGVALSKTLRNVDVFWIHPTTTRSQTDYNHDPLDPAVLKWTEESAVQWQASAFSVCCR